MLDTLERRLILAGCLTLVAAFSYGAWLTHKAEKVADAIAAAEAKHEAAVVAEGKAEVYDAQVKANEPNVQAAKAAVTRAKARLAVNPAAIETGPIHGETTSVVVLDALPDPRILELTIENGKLRDVVSSLDKYVVQLEGKVTALTLSGDLKTVALRARDQESVQLHAVIAAQQGLIKGALLKGRIQGLAVGLGSGYLAGKL